MDDEEGLSPAAAAEVIGRVTRWDAALRRRTEGLMWMLWGFVSAGAAATYAFVAASLEETPLYIGLLWIPWAAPGILATFLLWRSVGFVLPSGPPGARSFAAWVAGFFTVTVGAVAVAMILHLPVHPPMVILLGIGTATMLIGLARARRDPPLVVVALVGAAMAATAVWEALELQGEPFLDGIRQAALLNVPVTGLGLFLVGLTFYFRS